MIFYDGLSDIGSDREKQEDAIYQQSYDKNTHLFIVCDGAGMVDDSINPALIACTEVTNFIKRQYDYDRDMLVNYADAMLKEALYSANRVMGVFHIANEDKYNNFGCCMTACLVYDNKLTFAHCGNTRLHLIKATKVGDPIIKQLTVDHTASYEQFLTGKINEEEYLTGIDKLSYTSGLGIFANPEIQTMTVRFPEGNIAVLTTDGVHYAIWQQALMEIVLRSDNTTNAVGNLIQAAKMQKYPDNMSAVVIYNISEEEIEAMRKAAEEAEEMRKAAINEMENTSNE